MKQTQEHDKNTVLLILIKNLSLELTCKMKEQSDLRRASDKTDEVEKKLDTKFAEVDSQMKYKIPFGRK